MNLHIRRWNLMLVGASVTDSSSANKTSPIFMEPED
jgi:hypothetical protein